MADEIRPVAEEATDEALSKAYEDFKAGEEEGIEQVSVDVVKEEGQPPTEEVATADEILNEKYTQEEGTKIGRKIKKFELEKEQDRQRIAALETQIQTLSGKPITATFEAPQDDEAELERIRELYQTDPVAANRQQTAYDRQQSEKTFNTANSRYQSEYIAQVDKLAKGENEDLKDEIIAELYKEGGQFNKRHSQDPKIWIDGRTPAMEAMINYANVKAHILQNSTTTAKKPGTKGGTGTAPAGPAIGSRNEDVKVTEMPDLKSDPATRELAAYILGTGQKFLKQTKDDIAKVIAR